MSQAVWIFENNSPSIIQTMIQLAPNTYARLVEHLLRGLVTAA